MDSNQLDALLQELEAKVDKADPQQALLLDQARAHTKALQQARGDWERRSTSRSWNADALPEKDTPPLELPSYRDYAAFRTKDAARRDDNHRLPASEGTRSLSHGQGAQQVLEAARSSGSEPQDMRE